MFDAGCFMCGCINIYILHICFPSGIAFMAYVCSVVEIFVPGICMVIAYEVNVAGGYVLAHIWINVTSIYP